jgi:hypothetical protein
MEGESTESARIYSSMYERLMIDILKISLISFMFCALGSEGMIFAWYQRLINRLPDWLCKPLGGCYKCFTGQVMLWYFILFKQFNIIELLFFVSAGILCSMIYNKIYCYLK